MTLRSIPTFHSGNITTDLSGTREVIRSIIERPILDGNLIEKQELLPTVANMVSHRLGRKHRGWILTGIDTLAKVAENKTLSTDTQIALETDAHCFVSLWVF